MPNRIAEAGIFSSFLGDQAYAGANSSELTNNSQNMDLLQANVSLASIVEDKKTKKEEGLKDTANTKDIDGGAVKENTEIKIVSDCALLPTTNAMTADETLPDGDPYSEQISVYVIRKGDSIAQIAEMFDVSVNTILWANDMKKGDKLKENDVLFILPVSGVEHTVLKGQTLKGIAKLYKVEVADIARFNGIAEDSALTLGDKLIIPDGEVFGDDSVSVPAKKKKNFKIPTNNIAGYYINPVPRAIKTQGLHGRNSVDLAAPIGTPIYAAADGKVALARMGWNGAYGNMVIIEHPNGTKTLYSHLYKLASVTGQQVSQGEVIGYVGNSGRVRASKGGNGAHLHFEVHGAKNPGVNGSWVR